MTAVRRLPTIRDVASQAGVSVQTVSRVLNAKGEITEGTRQRVQRVITDLGYRPSASARSLASRRTLLLGLIAHHSGGGLFQDAIRGAVEEATRQGYVFVLAPMDVNPSEEPMCVRMLLERRVEGLLFVGAGPGWDIELLRGLIADGMPVVTIAWYAPGGDLEVVDVDNRDAGRQATAHLLELGHRRIAQIVGPPGWKEADDRAQGYLDAHAAKGAQADAALSVRAADWGNPADGYRSAHTLLARGQAFDGLVAHNDKLAIGALRALRECGLRVPDDVALVSFDDQQAEFAEPPLTSIRQPAAEAGRIAVRRLVSLIGAPERPRQVTELKTTLVVRASSAPRTLGVAARRDGK